MNIWCVGRNYQEHAIEMKAEVPKEPMFFLKSGNCFEVGNDKIILPAWSQDIHHEAELLVVLGEALNPVAAALAIDLTARDKQTEAKAKGQPWTLAKSFKGSCPSSPFFPVASLESLQDLNFNLKVNGEVRQQASTNQMIFQVEHLISFLREHFPVQTGDLLMTGTPAGVSALKSGDLVEVEIQGKVSHKWLCC